MAKRKKKGYGKHRHHRRCKSNGGGNHAGNISMVTPHHHRAWHLLFDTYSAHRIAQIINDIWLDTRYKLVVQPREDKSDDTRDLCPLRTSYSD